jgi:hypothetical protein
MASSPYVANAYIRFRERNQDLPTVETVAQLTALIDAATTASKAYINVTVTRNDVQYKSPTPVDTKPVVNAVTQTVAVMISNIVLIQDGANHAPTMF